MNKISRHPIERIRKDFPALHQKIHGYPLVFLDSAASALKPQPVLDAISSFSATDYANIHRGIYEMSQRSTLAYENVRRKAQKFLGAGLESEIVFVRGVTEAMNLLAYSLGQTLIKERDEILISAMEHHSNIVPWQRCCQQRGGHLRVIPMSDNGELELEEYQRLLGPRTKLVSLTHVSNALGTLNPLQPMIRMAHECGALVIVDGAQAVPHFPVHVQDLGCDFYAFSGHKLYGPTGVGVLYGKYSLLAEMEPYQTGGEMIASVSFEKTTFKDAPARFEAGTPDIMNTIGLGAAMDYLSQFDPSILLEHEEDLLAYATRELQTITGLRIIGTAKKKAGVVSFVIQGIHPHDISTFLDQEGIAVRAGHLCAQPVMDRMGIHSTTRASFGMYNTREDVDRLRQALERTVKVFS